SRWSADRGVRQEQPCGRADRCRSLHGHPVEFAERAGGDGGARNRGRAGLRRTDVGGARRAVDLVVHVERDGVGSGAAAHLLARSSPAPPVSLSSPAPPLRTSLPPRPSITSSPPRPQMMSSPGVPTRWSAPGVPRIAEALVHGEAVVIWCSTQINAPCWSVTVNRTVCAPASANRWRTAGPVAVKPSP